MHGTFKTIMATQHDNLPQTMPQLVGHGVTTIVGGLTPAMLGVLLLNCVGIAAAVYFLNLLIKGQQTHLSALLTVQERQMTQVLAIERYQFETLTEMVGVLQKDMKEMRIPPPVPEFPFKPEEPGGSP